MKIIALAQNIKDNSTPNRLRLAVNEYYKDADFKILTFNSLVDSPDVIEIKKGLFDKVKNKLSFFKKSVEQKINKYIVKDGFPFTIEEYGIDISKNSYIKNADIIQLHWLGGYFLSPNEIGKLINLKKPVIFVCHDNGHFTGGCHVRMECERFKNECGNCPQINSRTLKDWTYKTLKKKKRCYSGDNISVVSPSVWMDNNVSDSVVFANVSHFIIPNSVNQIIFFKKDKDSLREKYNIEKNKTVILFGAVNAVSSPYKGYEYLIESLKLIEKRNDENHEIEAVVFGADDGIRTVGKSLNIRYLGKLNEEQMSEAYNLAEVYVVPSLEDSFNNTVAESMACETPVVAFATGGINDIVDHKVNGYLAKQRDTNDLADGIEWVIRNSEINSLGIKAAEKINRCFTREIVAKKYYDLWSSVINK